MAFLAVLFAAPAAITYLISRLVTRFAGGAWQAPVAIVIAPLFVVTSTFGMNPDSKWCWPWSSFRSELVAMQANALVAMDRLQLPRDRELTKEELDRWQRESPLRATLRFPITHWEVVASVVNPWSRQLMPNGGLWMWWGDKTFGPFDLKTMHVLWASD